MNQCLMIKTSDNRRFFTHEKYFPELIEFSKALKAEISIVKIQDDNILELEELAPAICNGTYKNNTDYELIAQFKNIKSELPNKREQTLARAAKIKNYIENRLLNEKNISFNNVLQEFLDYKLNKATISNHIARVKSKLEAKGYKIERIGKGKYRLL